MPSDRLASRIAAVIVGLYVLSFAIKIINPDWDPPEGLFSLTMAAVSWAFGLRVLRRGRGGDGE